MRYVLIIRATPAFSTSSVQFEPNKCYSPRMKMVLALSFLTGVLMTGFAQQQPAADPVYRVGNGVKPPRPIFNPEPDLSQEPKRDRYKGPLVVEVIVQTDGKIHETQVLRSIGDPDLDAKAIEVMRSWIFGPCLKDQKPVNCKLTIEATVHIK